MKRAVWISLVVFGVGMTSACTSAFAGPRCGVTVVTPSVVVRTGAVYRSPVVYRAPVRYSAPAVVYRPVYVNPYRPVVCGTTRVVPNRTVVGVGVGFGGPRYVRY